MGDKSINSPRRNNCIAFMLLWLFVSYIGGISLFTHIHTIDGQAISHSHFYNGSAENPNHSHTSQHFKTIASLSLYISLAAAVVAVIAAPLLQLIMVVSYTTQRPVQHEQRLYQLRAPPIFI